MSLHTWHFQGPCKPSSCTTFMLKPHWGRAATGKKIFSCVQHFAILWTVARQASLSSRVLQARYWNVLANTSCHTLSLSHVQLFAMSNSLRPHDTAAREASLSITDSRSLPKLISIELVMPSNHLILCRPLLLLPSIFPSIRVLSYESALLIRWPKYWSLSISISSSS